MARAKKGIAEVEAVGKDLESRFTQAASETEEHDKKPTEAEYRSAYQRVQAGEISQIEAAKELGVSTSKGSVYRLFKKLETDYGGQKETSEAKSAETWPGPQQPQSQEQAQKAEPPVTAARITEILISGRLMQLDPRELLSGPGARRYQRRRFRSQIQLKDLAASIGKIGVIEPLIIREKSKILDRRLIVDGFGRADAWMMADETAGGISKKPVLEYATCLLIDCTDKEAAFIAFEKNRRRENFDEADRDYSIVMLHEQQYYSFDELADLTELDRSTISHIVHAFQDIPEKARTALQDRMITTKHAREIAKLKEWPNEQERLTNWLLEEISKPEFKSRKDANYDNGHPDFYGISSGRLGEMVGDVVERKKQAKAIAADLQKMKSDGKVDGTIDADKADKLRSQFSKSLHLPNSGSITKRTMQEAMKVAGVKLAKPIEATTDNGTKPKSPARFAEDREQPKLKPCLNCTIYHEKTENCLADLIPDKDNKCGVQMSGHPTRVELHCLVCGGAIVEDLLKKLHVTLAMSMAKNGISHYSHRICLVEEQISAGTLDGKCKSCQPEYCQILRTVWDYRGLKLVVNECPTETAMGGMFKPRPETTIDEANRQVKEYLDKLRAKASNESASGGTH